MQTRAGCERFLSAPYRSAIGHCRPVQRDRPCLMARPRATVRVLGNQDTEAVTKRALKRHVVSLALSAILTGTLAAQGAVRSSGI